MRRRGLIRDTAWPVWSVARSQSRWATARVIAVLALFLVWLFYEAARAGSALMVALAVVYGGCWLLAMLLGIALRPAHRLVLAGVLLVLGAALVVLRGDPAAIGVLAYALTAVAWLLPSQWVLLVAAAVTAAGLAATWIARGSLGWTEILGTVGGTVTPAVVILLVRLLVQLGRAQEEIETLAAAAERARLARDLHDVLGHTLTTVTAKTGLARRLLERGGDREQALAELRDVERLSREAHTEIRATVSGYRRPALSVELGGVRVALRAAGISATLPTAVDHVPADLREPFAYVLREGVANVIRHSGATRCEVQLGDSSLEIRDNGRGSEAAPGNGLSGLEERLHAVNGTLQAGPLPQGGFRLRASRP
ncbi:sensor histidine kinase [Microtetraspora fusca]|uniref:Sensor histidine kinase n=1 Tax=Microtetraspora fusca TaxID=1997 RepID=A0ABW6V866_MICFU